MVLQAGGVKGQSRVAEDGGTKPVWNERVALRGVAPAATPDLVCEVYVRKGEGVCGVGGW